MSAQVVAKSVTKHFGDHVALDDVSLEIAPGEIFGLIGPNGAGKTTFLRILTGYRLPSAGDVIVDGHSVLTERSAVQKRIGYACEQPRLYMDHTVQSFLALMGRLRGLSGASLRSAIDLAVERFGLEEVIKRRVGVLSKGFRQRVSLAQALLHRPPLLVIDEPTVGLDPRQQLELRRIIQSLSGSHTVLLCTHQLREAEACCNRVALLNRGRLVHISGSDEFGGTGQLEEFFLSSTQEVPEA